VSDPRHHRPDDWMEHAHLSAAQRILLARGRSHRPRLVFAVCLIALGVLLFLSNLGVLPLDSVWMFWPLLPLVGGISRLLGASTPGGRLWGVMMVVFGIIFTLLNLGWLHVRTNDGTLPLSLVMIAAGFLTLYGVVESSWRGQPVPREGFADTPPPDVPLRDVPSPPHVHPPTGFPPRPNFENSVNDFAVLGSVKRKLETNDFRGGALTTFFGGIEIDLRYAQITSPERSAVLVTTAVFGAVKLRVPQDWRVVLTGTSVLGNFEDKTVPPNTGASAPSLVITGWSVFGAVEIED